MTTEERGVIHIGWDNIEVFPNEHGDICIVQDSPIEGSEVVICIPRLYCDTFIQYVREACDEN